MAAQHLSLPTIEIRRGITDAAGTTLAQPIIYKSFKESLQKSLAGRHLSI